MLSPAFDRNALNALAAECTAFLGTIEHAEKEMKDANAGTQLLAARAHFSAACGLVERAERMGVVEESSFMRDQSGKSHWIGTDATLREGTPVPVIGPAFSFSYKTHCRVPVRTVRNAAQARAAL